MDNSSETVSSTGPIDLFLIISVLQANFCWIEDFEEMICPWLERVAGKKIIVDFMSRVAAPPPLRI